MKNNLPPGDCAMPAYSRAGIVAYGLGHGGSDVGLCDAELSHVEDVADGRGPQPLAAFAERLAVGWFVGHKRSCSAARDHDAIAFEFAIRTSDSAWSQAQLTGEVAHGGKSVSGREATDRHHHGQLSPELLEAGDAAAGIETDDESAGLAGPVGVLDNGVEVGLDASHMSIVLIQTTESMANYDYFLA